MYHNLINTVKLASMRPRHKAAEIGQIDGVDEVHVVMIGFNEAAA